MDAHALLRSQGWRGSGHSLHKTDDTIGLAKPILVSRKNNVLGVGRKSHVTSDQWWLNALDEQLRSLDTSGKTSIVQTKTSTRLGGLVASSRGPGGKYAGANGLYSCFVSGGLLQGTIRSGEEEEAEAGESTDATPEVEPVPVRKETREERRARREQRRRRKAAKAARQTAVAAEAMASAKKSKTKSKDRSKEGKEGEKKEKVKKSSNATAVGKSSKKNKSIVSESKEERRARKEAKRKRREEKDRRRKVEEG